MPTNADLCMVLLWSHAVSVGIHGGTACRGSNLGCLHILVLGGFWLIH